MNESNPPQRVRSFGYFVIAVAYFFFAQIVASRSANGLSSGDWSELVERLILLFLLLVGYSAMGRAFQGQHRPLQAMGLVVRPDWQREFGLGVALGWGMLIASILPTVLFGGFIVGLWTTPRQFLLVAVDILVLAVAALAEEVAFRGYPFQRLIEAVGPVLATIILAVLFGVAHLFNPGSSHASILITMLAGWLLCAAYLRTRALWFSWGWHFAWNVSMGVVFGLPISGLTRFSPVVQTDTIGPAWLTGSDYGPEASLVTAIVMLAGIIVLFRITRAYARKYAHPAAIPGEMFAGPNAVDLVSAPHPPVPDVGLSGHSACAPISPAAHAEESVSESPSNACSQSTAESTPPPAEPSSASDPTPSSPLASPESNARFPMDSHEEDR